MSSEGIPTAFPPRYMGIDFGRKRSHTEILILEEFEIGSYRVLTMKSLVNMNFEEQKLHIDDMIARFKPRKIEIDERGMGLPLLDYMQQKHGITLVEPLRLTNQQLKEKVVLQCRNAFSDLKIAIPEHDELYEQLHAYQVEYTDRGNPIYSGKVSDTDFMDDKVIALIAAVDAAKKKDVTFRII